MSFRTYILKIQGHEYTITKEMIKEIKRYEKEVHGKRRRIPEFNFPKVETVSNENLSTDLNFCESVWTMNTL